MADEIKAPGAPKPGTPEHDAAMVAKAEANAAKAVKDAAPLTQEDLQPEENKETPAGDEKKPEEPPKEGEEGDEKKPEEETQEDAAKEAEKALEGTGIQMDTLQAEYDKDGKLSDESMEKLEKAGFPKEYVEAFIAGQEALRERQTAKAFEAAGGEEQFRAMVEWAKSGMKPTEIEAYNKAVAGSEADMLQAINGLKSRFEAAYGKEPALIGGRNSNSGAQAYESREQMVADIRNPQYAKDPAFRAKVEARIAASPRI